MLAQRLREGASDTICLFIYGKPKTKGSSRAIPYIEKGTSKMRAAVMADNRDSLRAWEASVRTQAQLVAWERKGRMIDGPVAVRVYFGITRPKSAKKRPHPDVKPDLDKLVRAVLDPLTEVLFGDDGAICSIEAHKRYVDGASYAAIELCAMAAEHASLPLLPDPAPAAQQVQRRSRRAAGPLTAEDL